MRDARGARGLVGADVLEVGCGSGALLAQVVAAGAHGTGVEPGVQAAEHARSRGLAVIAEPFEPAQFADRRFDVIFHHAVLEHVPGPIEFLRSQLELLGDDGLLVCSVPDCSPPLAHGDISMLVHEHLSYFTPDSLACAATRAGGALVAARLSRTSGSTYCALRRVATGSRVDHLGGLDAATGGFVAAAQHTIAAIRGFVESIASEGRTLGIFCPFRFINYHALLGASVPAIRYFDDDPLLEGRYFPPVDVAIESRESLLRRPVNELVVMSWTFGDAIAASLRARDELAGTTIRTISEIIGG